MPPVGTESAAGVAATDGGFVAVSSARPRSVWEPGQAEVRVPSALVAVGEEGVDTLTVVPGRTWLVGDDPDTFDSSILLPLPRTGPWGRGVAFTNGEDQGMVEFYDSNGGLAARVATGTTGARLTPAVVAAHRAEAAAAARARTGGADTPPYPNRPDDPEWPDRLPAYEGILRDGAECVWLKHFRVPGEPWIETFDVVHPEQGLVATVTMPGPMRVRDIRGDRVGARTTDELGVQGVVLLRLRRSEGSACPG